MTTRRFYSPPENFNSEGAMLDEAETRHLKNVLRLRVGDEIAVFDGEGREYKCRIGEIGRHKTVLDECIEISPASPESPLDLTLCVAILKGEKFDLVVQKATEIGVKRLIPITTERTDAAPKNIASRIDRWGRIILEASKQSGRARLMQIEIPVDFSSIFSNQSLKNRVLFSERGGQSFDALPANTEAITAIVGPEGGWDDAELKTAADARIPIITLGGRILRAETAAISIAAVLQHRFGDFN